MKRKYRKISEFFQVTNVPDNNSDIDANNNDTPLIFWIMKLALRRMLKTAKRQSRHQKEAVKELLLVRLQTRKGIPGSMKKQLKPVKCFHKRYHNLLRRTSQLILFFLQSKQKLRTYTSSKNGIRNIHGYIMTRT